MSQGAQIVPIDHAEMIEQEKLRQLWQLWHDAHHDGRLPGRELIDPLKLRFLIGFVTVFDINPTPPYFVYRLLGQDIVDRIGVELTGKPLEAHPDPSRYKAIFAALSRVRDERKAMRMFYPISLRDERLPHEAILMPIADAEGQVIQALCGQILPDDAPRWRAASDI
jgi:hypothetical protein